MSQYMVIIQTTSRKPLAVFSRLHIPLVESQEIYFSNKEKGITSMIIPDNLKHLFQPANN